jgi:hypothetical protein
MTAPVLRSLDLEDTIVREACRGFVDPDRLIAHAQGRAQRLSGEYVENWRHIRPGLDRPREAMEEPVDAVNHLAFHIQEHPEDPANPEYLLAIQDLARAYERIRKAREP